MLLELIVSLRAERSLLSKNASVLFIPFFFISIYSGLANQLMIHTGFPPEIAIS